MIVVFVSKNDEEYNRYKAGRVKHVIRQLTYIPKSGDVVSHGGVDNGNSSSNALSASFESAMKQHPEEAGVARSLGQKMLSSHDEKNREYMIIPGSIAEYYGSGTFVVVIRGGGYINQLKQKSIRAAYQGTHAENLLAIVGEVISEAIPTGGQIVGEQDVTLLIHWGGVTDLAAEELKFNNVISTFDYKKYIGCKNLVFRELSSRRPSFNVQRHAIKVPVKKEEVDELLQRFESERAFADVKDIMTNYLRNTICGMDVLAKFMTSKEFREKIREVAKESKFAWLLEWTLFRELVKAASDDKIRNSVDNILNATTNEDREKSRALISQLLSEGLV